MTNDLRAVASSSIVRLFGRDWRPLRFWLPEILNRLKLPECIMRKARRDEVANLLKQARRDGIILRRDCWVYGPSLREVLKRAPKRKPNTQLTDAQRSV